MLRVVTNRTKSFDFQCIQIQASKSFSTLRETIEAIQKGPATPKIPSSSFRANNNNNDNKGNNSKGQDSINFEIKKPASANPNPFLNSNSKPSFGTSLRDSLRRVEEQNATKKPDPIASAIEKKPSLKTSVRDVGADVIRNLGTKGMGAIPQVAKEPLTPGEKKFTQKQTKIVHKRNHLENKFNYQSNRAPQQQQQQQPHHSSHPKPGAKNKHLIELLDNVDSEASPLKTKLPDYMKVPTPAPATASKPIEELKFVAPVVKEVEIISTGITIRELASKMGVKIGDVKAKLIEMGEMEEEAPVSAAKKKSNVKDAKTKEDDNMLLEADVAELVVLELGFTPKRVQEKMSSMANAVHFHELANQMKANAEESTLVKRSPIVSIMGHVDHGKTTLLDALRTLTKPAVTSSSSSKGKKNSKEKETDAIAKIAGTEAGGITQKLSAFSVQLKADEKVVFLDTPGHAAFSAMRGQGALATDIVVLVVAMDDGIQPQTLEAIKCAKDANCSMVVALNKIDRYPIAAERERRRAKLLADLAKENVLTEEYGGDVQVIEVAGKTGDGITSLVESLLIQAEVMELKACPKGLAEGIILDAHIEKGRGIVAEVLVKWGSLSVGDPIVVGCSFGRIKSLTDDSGKMIKTALPSQPVRVLGLRSMPNTGSELLSVENENKAKQIADRRLRLHELKVLREQQSMAAPIAATNPSSSSKKEAAAPEVDSEGNPIVVKPPIPSLGVILKADGLGSLEALKAIVNNVVQSAKDDIAVKILDASVGEVTLSDVDRASNATESMILGFNVNMMDTNTKQAAKQLDVGIQSNNIIYRLEEELINKIYWILPREKLVTFQVSFF
jgi:small GTP-binding protein